MNKSTEFVYEALRGTVAAARDVDRIPDPGYPTPDTSSDEVWKPAKSHSSRAGGGHEPLHAGFLGSGMPSAVDQGVGVLHLVKNYTGGLMNFAVGADLSRADGIDVETVLIDDGAAAHSNFRCSSPSWPPRVRAAVDPTPAGDYGLAFVTILQPQ
jgi:dihydroxyacetone kinase